MFGRFFLVCVISICIGACASTSTEAPQAPEQAASATPANVGSVTSNNSTVQPLAEGAPELDASALPQTVSAELDYDPNEKVCRREKETGSRFTTRVCRTRAEIEARKERDQEIMDSMNRRSGGSECALTGIGC